MQPWTIRHYRALALVAAGLAMGGSAIGTPALAEEATPVGLWKTIDDKTGKVKSVVHIVEANGELQGKVEKVFSPPADSEAPICDKCDGERKDQLVIGMTILWGLKKDGDDYSGGRILDPAEGKTYKCKIKVTDEGKKLQVRGYIGAPLLGRTQTWVRE